MRDRMFLRQVASGTVLSREMGGLLSCRLVKVRNTFIDVQEQEEDEEDDPSSAPEEEQEDGNRKQIGILLTRGREDARRTHYYRDRYTVNEKPIGKEYQSFPNRQTRDKERRRKSRRLKKSASLPVHLWRGERRKQEKISSPPPDRPQDNGTRCEVSPRRPQDLHQGEDVTSCIVQSPRKDATAAGPGPGRVVGINGFNVSAEEGGGDAAEDAAFPLDHHTSENSTVCGSALSFYNDYYGISSTPSSSFSSPREMLPVGGVAATTNLRSPKALPNISPPASCRYPAPGLRTCSNAQQYVGPKGCPPPPPATIPSSYSPPQLVPQQQYTLSPSAVVSALLTALPTECCGMGGAPSYGSTTVVRSPSTAVSHIPPYHSPPPPLPSLSACAASSISASNLGGIGSTVCQVASSSHPVYLVSSDPTSSNTILTPATILQTTTLVSSAPIVSGIPPPPLLKAAAGSLGGGGSVVEAAPPMMNVRRNSLSMSGLSGRSCGATISSEAENPFSLNMEKLHAIDAASVNLLQRNMVNGGGARALPPGAFSCAYGDMGGGESSVGGGSSSGWGSVPPSGAAFSSAYVLMSGETVGGGGSTRRSTNSSRVQSPREQQEAFLTSLRASERTH